MIKKISRNTLQQIFIDSLDGCNSFQIIDGLNPFHLTLNGKECYVYIKNLSPAYFSNPDIWRVQLPRRKDFEVIKDGMIDFILLGYDSENEVYTTWCPKWTKQRLNNGESVSFYSRFSLQEEAASTQSIKRLSLNNDGEVLAFPREHLEFILSNLKTFFQDESDYVAMGSKRRPEANEAYKTFSDPKNIGVFAKSMTNGGYSTAIIANYCHIIRSLLNDGYITRYRKLFLSCNNLNEYHNVVSEFCSQPEISDRNERWNNATFTALNAYIAFLSKEQFDAPYNHEVTNPHQGAIGSSQNQIDSPTQNSEGKNENSSDIDWETLYTNSEGKLTKIANPVLIDKLRRFLDCEYVSPVRAYNEIEDFYGDRYSKMDMGDWMQLFKEINWADPYVQLSHKSSTQTKTKSKTEILRVEYPDGRVIQHSKAIDTFIEVIEDSYPDLIHELNILHANINIVTKERSKQYASAQKEIADGWLVFTNINTRRKREDLLKISEELELGLKVDLVSTTTGEIITSSNELNASSRKKIKVTFPNGRTIQPNKVLESLVEVVKYAGPKRVKDLNIIVCADNLVLQHPKPRYVKPCKPVGDGWYVNTCSDTPTKYEQIKKISTDLGLNLQVEII